MNHAGSEFESMMSSKQQVFDKFLTTNFHHTNLRHICATQSNNPLILEENVVHELWRGGLRASNTNNKKTEK